MRHASMTALALVLGLAAAPAAIAQSDKAGEPKTSAAVTGCIQAGAQVSAEAFNALDDNGDGFIAQQEYVEKCGKAGATAEGDDAAKAHFASLDANRDQKLTQDEFKSPAVKRSDASGATSGAAGSSTTPSATQSRADAQGSTSSSPSSPTMSQPASPDRSTASSATGSASSPTSGATAPRGGQALAELQAEKVIGMDVVNAKGDEIGEVKDLVLDNQQVAHAVVSVGGFLGIGAKDVAVPFEQLRVGPENVILMSETSESELKQMPEYKKDQYSSVQRDSARKTAPATQPKQ